MKKSTRAIITGVLVEALLIGGGIWLAKSLGDGKIGYGGPNPEAAARTMEMTGAAAIPIALVFGLLFWSMRRKGE